MSATTTVTLEASSKSQARGLILTSEPRLNFIAKEPNATNQGPESQWVGPPNPSFVLNKDALVMFAQKGYEIFEDPKKLDPYLEKHKRPILITAFLVALYIRSWISILPLPGFRTSVFGFTLSLFVLSFLATAGGANTPAPRPLAIFNHFKAVADKAHDQFMNRILPDWVYYRAIPAVLLLSPTRAATFLVLLMLFGFGRSLGKLASDADALLAKVDEAVAKSAEHVRVARVLEMQALQVGITRPEGAVEVVKEVKGLVEGVVQQGAELAGEEVEELRSIAAGARRVAREEGDLVLAGEMMAQLEESVEKLGQTEKEMGGKVEEVKRKLWGLVPLE
ncbi:hypothetical protein B0T18DRAFT_411970 [Schizothecium vesticola]|uniref:Uncharacterized protein n=1 Tax=Schizothecium vesticola TaxID=314040 RepID=A0AA40K5E2_9PEZI|nr:hypothetical protein B0T18DRAFT_411970 [Schizothecium vesticola]